MPELPEVETIRLQLDKTLKGLKITGVEILTKKSFTGEIGEIRERRVIGVRRRAKITLIELEGGVCLAIHLKLTGQLIYRKQETLLRLNKGVTTDGQVGNREQSGKYCEQKDGPFAVCELPNKFTRVIISFDNGEKLYFNDLRIFGWIKVIQNSKFIPQNAGQNHNSKFKSLDDELGLDKFGPEANDENSFTLEYFKSILGKSKKPIKIVLMDQEKIAGIGNIYANEALFMAGILPTRPAQTVTETEIEKLRKSIIKVLNEAIKHKGSSDRDEAYRQITGEKGTHQNYILVYGKAGQKCPRCGGMIKRIALGGRGTFFCGNCQK